MLLNVILYSLLIVLLGGGLYAWIRKLLEWREDRFLDNKIGSWVVSQKNITVQIIPPFDNVRSLSEMENFFINIANIFTVKSKKDIYKDGKWYEAYTFEIHSRGGQIGIFCTMNQNHLSVFRSALLAHYPGTSVILTQDPLAEWPDAWKDGGFGPYKDMYCTDMIQAKSDMFPLKSWKLFQRGNDAPTSDPITVLFSTLEDIGVNEYIILQFIIRPFAAYANGTDKRWKLEFEALREELSKNAVVDQTDAGQVQVLTPQEREILNMCEIKMLQENFLVKVRVGIFSDKPAPVRLLGTVMNYFKQFASEKQFIKPSGDTKTNVSDDGGRFGVFGPHIGAWLDTFYWKHEQRFRYQKMYSALKGRSLSKGVPPTFIDVAALAAMIHFPITSIGVDKSLVSRITSDYSSENSMAISQPPSNLPI